jgi:hypothetical protein
MPDDKLYRFSFGDSSKGALGAVITVIASSEAEALERAKGVLRTAFDGIINCSEHVSWGDDYDEDGAEYFNVYLNPGALTLKDIEEVEDLDEDDEEEPTFIPTDDKHERTDGRRRRHYEEN